MLSSSTHAAPSPTHAALPDRSIRAEVTVNPARDLIIYTLAGFLDRAAVDAVREGQSAALNRLRCGPNQHLTMIDIAECKIQAQDVIEAFREMLDDPRHQARRLAVVVGSSLARMQVRRVLHREAVGYFATAAEAKAWLFA